RRLCYCSHNGDRSARGDRRALDARSHPEPREAALMAATEFSAGGVVINDANEVVVIVPTRRAADGSKVLALPKGHPDGRESPAEAALREVREEAGVVTEVVGSLGEVRYWYQRGGRRIAKVVEFFLLRYVSG